MTAGPRRKGTGGHGRRRLAGKGPTPPAHLRPGHPANRRAAARQAGQDRQDDRRGGAPPGGDALAGDGRGDGARGGAAGGKGAAGPAGERRKGEPSGGGSAPGGSRFGEWAGSTGGPRARGRPAGAARRSPAAQARGTDAAEIVAGRNSVLESLRAGVPATVLYVGHRLAPDDRVAEAVKLAAGRGIAVLEAGRPELDRLTDGALHQGLALRVPPYEYAHPGDLTARASAAGAAPLIVALDGVTDPRNLGAVVRSAAAFGAHGVVIPARRAAGVTAAAWKVSAGALARLPVARAANLVRALASYQEAGLFVVGLDARGTTDVASLDVADGPLVLVVGSEGRGLARLTAARCDLLVRIPVAAATESLNVGVAAGIALYEVARTRAGTGPPPLA